MVQPSERTFGQPFDVALAYIAVARCNLYYFSSVALGIFVVLKSNRLWRQLTDVLCVALAIGCDDYATYNINLSGDDVTATRGFGFPLYFRRVSYARYFRRASYARYFRRAGNILGGTMNLIKVRVRVETACFCEVEYAVSCCHLAALPTTSSAHCVVTE